MSPVRAAGSDSEPGLSASNRFHPRIMNRFGSLPGENGFCY
jgi:hypothetical protein